MKDGRRFRDVIKGTTKANILPNDEWRCTFENDWDDANGTDSQITQ